MARSERPGRIEVEMDRRVRNGRSPWYAVILGITGAVAFYSLSRGGCGPVQLNDRGGRGAVAVSVPRPRASRALPSAVEAGMEDSGSHGNAFQMSRTVLREVHLWVEQKSAECPLQVDDPVAWVRVRQDHRGQGSVECTVESRHGPQEGAWTRVASLVCEGSPEGDVRVAIDGYGWQDVIFGQADDHLAEPTLEGSSTKEPLDVRFSVMAYTFNVAGTDVTGTAGRVLRWRREFVVWDECSPVRAVATHVCGDSLCLPMYAFESADLGVGFEFPADGVLKLLGESDSFHYLLENGDRVPVYGG